VQVIGMSPALASTASPIEEPECRNFASYQAKAEWDEELEKWVWEEDGDDSPQCGGCGNPGVDGSSYLHVSGDDNSATVSPKPGVIIESIKSGGGPSTCRQGSPAGGGSWTVSGDAPALSNIVVCFKICVDDVQ
jgi:hypothetical protein